VDDVRGHERRDAGGDRSLERDELEDGLGPAAHDRQVEMRVHGRPTVAREVLRDGQDAAVEVAADGRGAEPRDPVSRRAVRPRTDDRRAVRHGQVEDRGQRDVDAAGGELGCRGVRDGVGQVDVVGRPDRHR
jgi:hypothetical protein